MTPHLIPHYGPHVVGLILALRPLAYPGLYAPSAVRPSLCDWFDPAADVSWHTAEAAAPWTSPATGGWKTDTADQDWKTDAAGGGWRVKKPCA